MSAAKFSARAAYILALKQDLQKLEATSPSLSRNQSTTLPFPSYLSHHKSTALPSPLSLRRHKSIPLPFPTKKPQGVGKPPVTSKTARRNAGLNKARLAERVRRLIRQDRAAQAEQRDAAQLSLGFHDFYEPEYSPADLERIAKWVESVAVINGGDDSKDELAAQLEDLAL
jgi:hypothetical protein